MKRIAGNDSMEFLEMGITDDRPRYMTHNRQMLDQRADWAMRLLSSWGSAAAMADIFAKYGLCEEHKNKEIKQVPPQEMMMRICEVVDAAWGEMLHRGWIVDTGSIGD